MSRLEDIRVDYDRNVVCGSSAYMVPMNDMRFLFSEVTRLNDALIRVTAERDALAKGLKVRESI